MLPKPSLLHHAASSDKGSLLHAPGIRNPIFMRDYFDSKAPISFHQKRPAGFVGFVANYTA
jgi:hypothetical protein